MLLPIYAFGQPVLKKKAQEIDKDYPNLEELIDNMYETMYNASGVGLAAPQIGLGIRLFVIDTIQTKDEGKKEEGIKMALINAEILEEGGNPWTFEEGCLSIPDIHGDVERKAQIKVRYYDSDWKLHETVFNGMNARVIQHEYDHIEGVLFTEYLKPLKRRRIKRALEKIKRGDISPNYKMKFVRL